MNIRALAFIDTSMMTANLLIRHRSQMKDGVLPLWDEKALPILTDFKSAKMVLNRIIKSISNDSQKFELVRAAIETLAPNVATEWTREDGMDEPTVLRLHCCLVPCPGAWVYSGGETSNPPVGQLTLVNHRVLHCEANFGLVSRIHLVADVRPEAE